MTVARFQDAPGRPSGPVRLVGLTRPLPPGQRGVSPEFNYTFVPHGWNAATWPPSAHAGTHRDTPIHSAAGPVTIAPPSRSRSASTPPRSSHLPRRTRPPGSPPRPSARSQPPSSTAKASCAAPIGTATPPGPRAIATAFPASPTKSPRGGSPPPRKKSSASSRPPSPRPTRPHPGPGPFSLAWFNPRAGPARSAANAATGGAKLTLAARSTTDWPAVVRALPARGAAPK